MKQNFQKKLKPNQNSLQNKNDKSLNLLVITISGLLITSFSLQFYFIHEYLILHYSF